MCLRVHHVSLPRDRAEKDKYSRPGLKGVVADEGLVYWSVTLGHRWRAHHDQCAGACGTARDRHMVAAITQPVSIHRRSERSLHGRQNPRNAHAHPILSEGLPCHWIGSAPVREPGTGRCRSYLGPSSVSRRQWRTVSQPGGARPRRPHAAGSRSRKRHVEYPAGAYRLVSVAEVQCGTGHRRCDRRLHGGGRLADPYVTARGRQRCGCALVPKRSPRPAASAGRA